MVEENNWPEPPVLDTETHTSRVSLEYSQKYLRKMYEEYLTTDLVVSRINPPFDVDSDNTRFALGIGDDSATYSSFFSDRLSLVERGDPPSVFLSSYVTEVLGTDECDWTFVWRPEYSCWQNINYCTGDREVLLFPKTSLWWDAARDVVEMLCDS